MKSTLNLTILIGLVCGALAENALEEVFSWKKVDFEYPDEKTRQEAIDGKEFIPENNLPLGIERWMNKLFITFPRWKNGVAATLTYIDLNTAEKMPKFKPYPNWDAHKIHSSSGDGKIVSVFRMNVDVCDRLWLQDRGNDMVSGKAKAIKDNNIQVYDLKTDTLIREYAIPKDFIRPRTWIMNIIVETSKENCDEAYAYLADLDNQLIVYNFRENESWKVIHPFFYFDPLSVEYNIGGMNYLREHGLFGLAISPMQADGYSTLYFHPISSTYEFCVPTRILRNKTLHDQGKGYHKSMVYHEFMVLGSRGPSTQSSGESLDPQTGVLFYTLLNKNAIGCYNTFAQLPYETRTNPVIVQDNTTMIFPNDLKIDKTGTLWLTTDKLPNFLANKLDYNDVNFRVMKASVDKLVEGTVCDKKLSAMFLERLMEGPNESSSLIATNSLLFFVIIISTKLGFYLAQN